MKEAKSSNQAEVRTTGHSAGTDGYDPERMPDDGLHIRMPGAGVKHGSEIHYDTPTRSDSNKG